MRLRRSTALESASAKDDRIARYFGYMMVTIYTIEVLSLGLDGIFFAYGATVHWWSVITAILLLVLLSQLLYRILRRDGLRLRDWWSLYFAYTLMPSWERCETTDIEMAAAEVAAWCHHNMRGRWCMTRHKMFRFNLKTDAALFKLFWG